MGLFLARAGLKNATPRGTAILVVAANAPDFDAVSFFMGSPTYILWHRNITHSLVGLPFMALLTIAIVRVLGRRAIRWWPAFLIAVIGVASHLILDLTNSYGVRLLLPFSSHWFHWDIAPIFDIGLWAILLLGAIAPWFGRLVGSEIGEQKRGPGKGWAIAALVLFTAWDYGRSVLHDRVVATMGSYAWHDERPLRAAGIPGGNPLIWGGLAELSDAYVSTTVDLRQPFRPDEAETYYKAAPSPAIGAAAKTLPFERFLGFVQYPIWVTEPAPDLERATQVRLVDMRFGTPTQPGFEAVATVSDRGQVVSSTFGMAPPRVR